MAEQPKIAERFQQAVDKTSSARKKSAFFYVIWLAVILAVGFDIYIRFEKVPVLQDEKVALIKTSQDLESKLSHLRVNMEQKDDAIFRMKTLLGPFEKAAQLRYPGPTEVALDKLGDDLINEKGGINNLKETSSKQQEEIKNLRRQKTKRVKEIAGLKEKITSLEQQKAEQNKEIATLTDAGQYVAVATWDMDGNATLWDSRQIKTPVSGWIKDFRRKKDAHGPGWECGSMALYHYREVMEAHPKYPFTYYVVAKCLQAKAEPSWKEYAEKGVAIFKKTTRLPIHATDHDDALVELSALLKAKE